MSETLAALAKSWRRRNQHDLAAVGSSAFCGDAVALGG